MPLSEFLFTHLSEPYALDTVDGRAALARAAAPYLQQVQGDFYRHLLRRELAERTRLTEEELETLIYQQPKPQAATPAPEQTSRQEAQRRFVRTHEQRAPHTLTLAEQLIIVLINEPHRTQQFPLPEKLHLLDIPYISLLTKVYQSLSDTPHLTPAALLGRLMAQEEGQHLSQLLHAAHTMPMSQDTSERFCRGAFLQLDIRILEQEITLEHQQESPDPKRLLEIGRASCRESV